VRVIEVDLKPRGSKMGFIGFMGDAHVSNRMSHHGAIQRDMDNLLMLDEKVGPTRAISMGDWFDGIPMIDKRFDPTEKSPGVSLDRVLTVEGETVRGMFKDAAHLFVTALRGNHEESFRKKGLGVDPHWDLLCDPMGIADGSYEAIVIFRWKWRGERRHISVYAHHGVGGGKLVGGKFNTVSRFLDNHMVDIAAMGHVHDSGSYERVKLEVENGVVRARAKIAMLTGTYLMSYREQETESGRFTSGYGAIGGYSPSAIGGRLVAINFKTGEFNPVGKIAHADWLMRC
jgi:hypothetical protein